MTNPQSKKDIKTGVRKPPVCKVDLESIPEVLKQFPRWVFWKWVRKKGEWTKVPYDPKTGKKARPNDPSTWATWEQLYKVIKRPGAWKPCGRDFDGIGFFFHEDDGFCGTDLDDAIDISTGKLKSWAQKIVDALSSYTEISPSGTGVKIIAAGKKPGTRCKKNLPDGEVEMYDNARYFCLTGKHSAGTPATIEDRTREIALVYDDVFGKTTDKKKQQKGNKESEPKVLRFETTLSDTEIVERASVARNGYKFARLINGDTSDYSGDHSRADAAFCTMLAFWCDRDAGQMDRIFRASGLMRAKWDERRGSKTYGERTLEQACSISQETYRDYRQRRPSEYLPRTPSGPASDVTEEELLAAAIPPEKCGYYTYPDELCPNPGHMLLQHLHTYKLRPVLNRCGSSSCPQCFKRKKRLRHESLCRHMAAEQVQGGKLYCASRSYTKKEWDTVRRSILRRDGQFIRYRQSGDFFVVIATLPFTDSELLSFNDCEAFAERAVRSAIVEGPGKPFFTSSKGWAMAREKEKREYKKIGNIPMPTQAVKRLCRQFNIAYKEKRPEDSAILVDTFIDYAPKDIENDIFVKALLSKATPESYIFSMHDSDSLPSGHPDATLFPAWWDEYLGWAMNPTG